MTENGTGGYTQQINDDEDNEGTEGTGDSAAHSPTPYEYPHADSVEDRFSGVRGIQLANAALGIKSAVAQGGGMHTPSP